MAAGAVNVKFGFISTRLEVVVAGSDLLLWLSCARAELKANATSHKTMRGL